MVVADRGAHVDELVHVERRHDVDQRQPLDPVGVVERQPVRHPGAAVVAGDEEALVAEAAHQRRHVGGHRPLAVQRVVGLGRGRGPGLVESP